jgi:hypothetical protein
VSPDEPIQQSIGCVSAQVSPEIKKLPSKITESCICIYLAHVRPNIFFYVKDSYECLNIND